ncbi:MAG: cyclopropane-fatty-acyl-phospholipid synthase [Halioglobus sp.]
MLLKLLEQGVKEGTIVLYYGDGRRYRFGHGAPRVAWHLRDRRTGERIARNHPLQLGQTYMDGDWHVTGGSLQELLFVLRRNFSDQSPPRLLAPALKLLQQWNNAAASARNVSRHYDLDRQLFELFLDRDMHYSCAYFEREGVSLEEAQQAKCRHIARKLLLRPGDRVLDIGCGWGSFARYLAQHHEVDVTGITLSREQLEYARSRARNQGLGNLRFELKDYREHEGQYDRIVSIGMFEHVGRPFHRAFFRQLRHLLKPDGVALIHTIGRGTPPGPTNPWIRRHIFPGGAIPALSEMAAAAEQSGVMQTDIEVLRLHYAHTLRAWYDRFNLHRADIAERLGESFCRMWEFYLAACEVSFRCADLLVYQQQLALQHGSVPVTRDYLYEPQQWAETAPRRERPTRRLLAG